MDARELRLGNWVQLGESTVQVDIITEYEPDNKLVSKCEPIQLSEHWLKKAGFERGSKYKAYNLLDRWHKRAIDNHRNGLTLLVKDGYYTIKGHSLIELKYIHQLQNLYYALCGNELIFNHG